MDIHGVWCKGNLQVITQTVRISLLDKSFFHYEWLQMHAFAFLKHVGFVTSCDDLVPYYNR